MLNEMVKTPEYTVHLKKSAEKELKKLPDLKSKPVPAKAKKLKGKEGFRIRVGDYRILYIIVEKELKIEIISIGHRKDVYR